ncbi:MAG: hypothetical protein NWE99_06555 [Candidatus Bathyarchaeota archaeon]|nr:hypothetical protein [Candidatus Bathyarchaeota archaeon]
MEPQKVEFFDAAPSTTENMVYAGEEMLGIALIHFGNQVRTRNCLNSLLKAASRLKEHVTSVKTSILIVDNSDNFNLENCQSESCEVMYYSPGKNLGFAGACCLAANLLKKCSILIFSNNDVILHENSLVNLFETMKELPEMGALQPLVILENSFKVDSLGLTSNALMQGFNYSNWSIHPIRTFVLENGLKVLESFGIDGMFFMISKEIWDETGGWDPEFFMFNEDSLLSWKLRLSGYKNYVALNSVIYHERGGTAEGRFLKKKSIFPSYYISRNKLLSVLYIHEGVWLLIYFLGAFFFEFAKNLLISLKTQSASNLYYYFKALIFILCRHKHIILERSKVRRSIGARSFLKQGYILSIPKSIALMLKRRKSVFE